MRAWLSTEQSRAGGIAAPGEWIGRRGEGCPAAGRRPATVVDVVDHELDQVLQQSLPILDNFGLLLIFAHGRQMNTFGKGVLEF